MSDTQPYADAYAEPDVYGDPYGGPAPAYAGAAVAPYPYPYPEAYAYPEPFPDPHPDPYPVAQPGAYPDPYGGSEAGRYGGAGPDPGPARPREPYPYPSPYPDGAAGGPYAPDPYAPDPYGPAGPLPADPHDGPDPAAPAPTLPDPHLPDQAPPDPTAPVPGPRPGRRRKAPAPPATPAPARTGGRRRGAPAGRPAADSWRRIVPQALVVAFLAGGTSAFVAADKSVRLTVDGVPRTLHTFADDVDELLRREGVGIGAHDLVAPAPGSDLDDGDEIVVRYGRPLRLTLDGEQRQAWTTAVTVEAALRQLGVRVEGAYLSASRSAPVPRRGLALNVRTERSVTFMADGRESTIRTNAATVREALDQAGIVLSGQDTTSVPPDSFPRDGQTVTVLRITGTREVREEQIPYATRRVKDPGLFAGTEVVERAGRPGARRVTFALRTVNGVRQKPRRIAEETVREPVDALIKVGTKPLPTSVAGADGLDWGALAQCESGGRPGAVDPSGTYGGLYQFDVRTWQGLGGSGRPQDASGAEQTYRAKKLYVQRGASPWPHCGRRLYR
ncbi:ubiquitin-like domain-containing protein [Streptomyces sp. NPDC012888]|uniref:ubiquitin-like domain-containing protein n=1 Tax=Streptomyces sp. NPDC012888 TaxID=3364855 RepID=UPI0036A9FDDB